MRIVISAIGKEKSSSAEAKIFQSYIKRIPWNVQLKEFSEKRSLPADLLSDKEAQMLLGSVNSGAKIVALDERGENPSSLEFAKQLSKWREEGVRDISFLIGGANGHGQEVRNRADYIFSLGKLTWPHMMVRFMLAEQLYRAYTIQSGHPYHKE